MRKFLPCWEEEEEESPRLGLVDPSSYSEPELIKTEHIDIDWKINFDKRTIEGTIWLHFRVISKPIQKILLDVRDLKIEAISIKSTAGKIPLRFDVTDTVPEIGSKLTIELPTRVDGKLIVAIKYETSPEASGLQWLTAEQTLGKRGPYLFSQSQPIRVRSFLPCQDTPAVKFTYNATLMHPSNITVLMGAIRQNCSKGVTKYEQKIPIPSYSVAIAAGILVSRDVGPRSKVWAEAEQIDEAAEEFSGTEHLLKTAESICGPYVWKQYDLLVLPPSFPYGGSENPCLTFVTPTILAGDKSLVDVVAHEISHSWTGNLVTNMNHEHFWLNEGFTVFVEGKIMGRLYGDKFRDFFSIHQLSELWDTLSGQLKNQSKLSKLVVDLSESINPEDSLSEVQYGKGSTFLRYLEDLLGGPEIFEKFLRAYIEKFKYQSLVTDDFKDFLHEYFSKENSEDLAKINWDAWLYGEGMPPIIPKFDTSSSDVCKKMANFWSRARTADIIESPSFYQQDKLTAVQIIEFLSQLLAKPRIEDLSKSKIEILAKAYDLNESKNSEIRFRYMRLCIKARLTEMMDEILKFANSNFRMKFVRPIYRELAEWPEAKSKAIANFEKVKNQMMAVCVYNVEKDLGLRD